eukprot:TRINITY_DN50_c1_g1_i4.p1 TRINITY_DN50_c1_g1~~TRINITY_DN50_c1_g1_i4.p1  ORF type:complete len:1122 (-),score=321.77 TRINITY_DN50_c1_g1_i4:384-3749(-)
MGQFLSKNEEESMRLIKANDPEWNRRYLDNTISNTKYTLLNFLPKNMKEQFGQAMNQYFLLIACLQLINEITPVNPMTTWGPLLLIFGLTAFKELMDDLGRRKADKMANERRYSVVRDGKVLEVMSSEIQVGDIVKMRENEEFPCDLILLSSSDPAGNCYIQTTNLDGETNLKVRLARPETQQMQSLPVLSKFQGEFEVHPPNDAIYVFNSKMKVHKSQNEWLSLSSDQLLLQATHMRNTDYAFGLACYTGNESKFGKNKEIPPPKQTKTDVVINHFVQYIFVFQLVLVLIFGIWGNAWKAQEGEDMWYLHYEDLPWYQFIIIPARFLLLNSTMIPISLKVTIDFCKWAYSMFINKDVEMIGGDENEFAHANSTALSEDLGQVQYVLTDKTGTLTQNLMVLKQMSVGGRVYFAEGPSIEPKKDLLSKHLHDSIPPPDWATQTIPRAFSFLQHHGIFSGVMPIGSHETLVLEAFRCLALNNTVIPALDEKGNIIYKAASPDEEALVKGAAMYGVKLMKREGYRVVLSVLGAKEEYELLQECEFTADRKRMTVVVRDLQNGCIRMYTKGADDQILKRLQPAAEKARLKLISHVDAFAVAGLRTLVLGYRDLTNQEFESWKAVYDVANTAMVNRDEEKEKCFETLEQNFWPIGSTAVEDKLQDRVPETIALLRRADVKIWMCTGDKYSTALTIAHSCNLKTNNAQSLLIPIEGKDEKDLVHNLEVACRQHLTAAGTFRVTQQHNEMCVIVRGFPYLNWALLRAKENFTKLMLAANAVVCCRLIPKQKADLVKLVADAGFSTLAIGDGGNDVIMIQQARVGVGIAGKEGLQAARASDFRVTQFKHLLNLMFIHGRYSYYRTCLVAQYSFYKSFVFCFMQIAFGFYSGFSGSSLFNSLCVAAYNALLFFPIVSFFLDKDIEKQTIMSCPLIYKTAVSGANMNGKTMLVWLGRSFYQAMACLLIVFSVSGTGVGADGNGSGEYSYETLGLVAFTSYLFIQDFTMVLGMTRITIHNLVLIIGFHIFAILLALAASMLPAFSSFIDYQTMTAILLDPNTWLVNFLVIIIAILPVEFTKAMFFFYKPSETDCIIHTEHSRSLKQTVSTSPSKTPYGSTEKVLPLFRVLSK